MQMILTALVTSILAQPSAPPETPPPTETPPAPDTFAEPHIQPVEEAAGEPEATEDAPAAAAPSADEATQQEIEAALAADTAATDDESAPSPDAAPASTNTLQPTGSLGGMVATLNPDISVILDAALAAFSDPDNLQTGGHDPVVNGFNLQQLELSIGAAVDPYFRFDSNIVFGQEGVEVEEAYGTTLALPGGLQSRFGQFLHRFGRINPTHPHTWDFVDQPFSVGRVFGGEGGRGLGVELSWLTPLPWYTELVGTAMQANGEGTARSFFGENDPGVQNVADLLYVAALKQFFAPDDDWSILLGLSGAFGPNATAVDRRTDVAGADLYVKYRPVTRQSQMLLGWQSEVFYRYREVPGDALQDVSLYTQLVLRMTQRWGLAARYEYGSPATGNDGSTGADDLDPDWTESRHRFSANVTFWPTEFSRLRLQGSHDLPEWQEQGIWAAFLTGELVIGAHGAHTF